MEATLPVLELQYLDETGSKGATTVKYPVGTTYAVMDAQASALASLIAPITGCVLIRQRIIYKAVATPRDVPDTGSLIHNAGMFIFSTVGGEPYEMIAVPGILEEVLRDDEPFAGVGVDVGNSDVVAFVASVLAASCTNPFGDVIDALVTAYRQSRA